ncbi:MAG: hypothetical protein ACK2UB_00985 [Anaerolineales bacterium]
MNIFLWILQIILAIKFISVAYSHGLRQGQTIMAQGIGRMGPAARPVLYLAAVFSLIAGALLVLPAVVVLPAATVPLAAAVLAAMNLLSMLLHRACREKPNLIPGLVLFLMAAFTAYGRYALAPL